MGGRLQLDPFDIEFVNLTHSIPEPNALLITTPQGKIFHTGDWKLDPDPLVGSRSDEAYLKAIGDSGVLALVCDSTNVFVEGQTVSEAEVRQSLIELIGKQKGRVAIALFASNVARFESCAYAAMVHQRHVVLVGRSLHRINQAARACGYLKDIPEFLTEGEAAALPPERVLLICTGSQGEPRAALTRIAEKSHPSIRFEEGDTVIFSSRRIPGNEKAIADLHNKLQKLGLTVITDGQEFTHASGHPGRAELLQMYKFIRPQVIVPVHGEEMHLHEQASLGLSAGIKQAIVPHNGSVIRLTGGSPAIIDQVHSGRLCRDGNRVVPLFSAHLRERHKLMVAGLVAITLSIDRKGAIAEPELSLVGIAANEGEGSMIREAILREIAVGIKEATSSRLDNDKEVKDMLRKAAKRAVNSLCGFKPIIVTHVVRAF
jgi:ribonuclease J